MLSQGPGQEQVLAPEHFQGELAKTNRDSKTIFLALNPGQGVELKEDAFPGTGPKGKNTLNRGIYRFRLAAMTSHEGTDAAFFMNLKATINEVSVSFSANDFLSAMKETPLEARVVIRQPGPLQVRLSFEAGDGFERGWTLFQGSAMAKGAAGPKPEVAIGEETTSEEEAGEDALNELERMLNPATEAFFAVRELRLERAGGGAVPSDVHVSKILYNPGETLFATYKVTNVSEQEENCVAKVFLESRLDTRQPIEEQAAALKPGESRDFTVSAKLPEEELGYGLVVEGWTGGRLTAASQDVFNIAKNVYRVAIHGPGGPGMIAQSEEAMVRQYEGARALWSNCFEVFAWAPCDFSEMTPEKEVWYSGQTCYQVTKSLMKRSIDAGHEHGIKAITYGKFIASGYFGWKFAMENPFHFKGNFFFPAGQWEPTNVPWLDSMRDGDYHHPGQKGWFYQEFLPINPDSTPEMVEFSAMEILASAKMFGWDGVRWDGQPSGPEAIALTKKVIGSERPDFVYGYNYMPSVMNYEWAMGNLEFDEICRGGGLVMNEAIRGAYAPIPLVAGILQVGGDLCRERGGYYLGISQDQISARDDRCMAALWFAAGCRPMSGAAKNPAFNRFATRYSALVFDENMRRLAAPEKILQPAQATDLWYTPFVYEAPGGRPGRSFLVVHLLNLPQDESVIKEPKEFRWLMRPKASDAVDLQLNLPEGAESVRAVLIDPLTLERSPLPITKNQALHLPVINFWKLLVVELKSAPGAKTLAELYGPPATLGMTKEGKKAQGASGSAEKKSEFKPRLKRVEIPNHVAMEERNSKLLEQRLAKDVYLKMWSKRSYLDQDDSGRQNWKTPENLQVRRNGRLDVLMAKGIWYHWLRMDEAALLLDAYFERECLLSGRGAFSDSSGWYSLSQYPAAEELQAQDVVVFMNIPAVAISSQRRFELRDYVQSGGGWLLAGGQWAFGKGLTAYTVLEDLLPVTMIQSVDVQFFDTHAELEAGPEAGELLPADLDWSQKPLVECTNEVHVKDGAKVFLQCGNVPLLVGWQFGRGRVLAWTGCAMGSAPARRLMFWEWSEWPRVASAMLRWLAGDFKKVDASPPPAPVESQAERRKLEEIIERLTLSGESDLSGGEAGLRQDNSDEEKGEGKEGLEIPLPGGRGTLKATGQIEQDLQALCQYLEQPAAHAELAKASADAAISSLSRTEGIPESIRERVLTAAARYPNPEWLEYAQALLRKLDPELKGLGYRITAISGASDAAHRLAAGLKDRDELVRIDVLLSLAASDSHAAAQEVAAELNRIDDIERGKEAGQTFDDLNPWTLQVSWEEELMRMAATMYLYRNDKAKFAQRQAFVTLRMRYYLKVVDRAIAGIYAGMFNQPRSAVAAMQRQARHVELLRRNMGRLHQKQVALVLEDGPVMLEGFAKAFAKAHWLDEVNLAIRLAAASVTPENFRALFPLLASGNPALRTLAVHQILSHGNGQDKQRLEETLETLAGSQTEEDMLFCLENLKMFHAASSRKIIENALLRGQMGTFRKALHNLSAVPSAADRSRLLELASRREEHDLRDLARIWKSE